MPLSSFVLPVLVESPGLKSRWQLWKCKLAAGDNSGEPGLCWAHSGVRYSTNTEQNFLGIFPPVHPSWALSPLRLHFLWVLLCETWILIYGQKFLGFTVAKICIFWFLLCFFPVHIQAHKGEGRKESGPKVPGGILVLSNNFLLTWEWCWQILQKVTSGVLGQVSPECDSRIFGEMVDLAIQDSHIGSAPWYLLVWRITAASSLPTRKAKVAAKANQVSGPSYGTSMSCLITFCSKKKI